MKIVLKILSAALLSCAVLALFSSCAENQSESWLKYKSAEISEASYRFWLATTKEYAVRDGIKDTLEGWNERWTDSDGQTYTTAEYIEKRAQEYAVKAAVKLQLFNEYGLKLSEKQTAEIDDYLNKIIYEKYGDSKSAFNDKLKEVYGVTLDELRETLLIESKASALDDHLFGENGTKAITKEEKDEYFERNYVRLQIVAINLEKEYVLDDKGNLTPDGMGGYQIKTYTEEEKEKKKQIADAVLGLANEKNSDFTDLVNKYSDQINKTHADGIYFSLNDKTFAQSNGIPEETVMSMFSQELEKVVRYDVADKAVFIVKRLALVPGAYAESSQSDRFLTFAGDVRMEKMNAFLDPMLGEVEVSDKLYALRVVDIQKGIL